MSNVMNEGQMWDEIERLHAELAKANGACGEMSYELSSVLHDLQRVEHQRDVMQHRLEQAEQQRDAYMRQLGKRAALLPPSPITIAGDGVTGHLYARLQVAESARRQALGAVRLVGQMLDRLAPTTPLEEAHRIITAIQQTVRETLGQVPDPAADVGGHNDAG